MQHFGKFSVFSLFGKMSIQIHSFSCAVATLSTFNLLLELTGPSQNLDKLPHPLQREEHLQAETGLPL